MHRTLPSSLLDRHYFTSMDRFHCPYIYTLRMMHPDVIPYFESLIRVDEEHNASNPYHFEDSSEPFSNHVS